MYAALQPANLKKLLKAAGLRQTGKKGELVSRHRKFIDEFNTLVDARQVGTEEELVGLAAKATASKERAAAAAAAPSLFGGGGGGGGGSGVGGGSGGGSGGGGCSGSGSGGGGSGSAAKPAKGKAAAAKRGDAQFTRQLQELRARTGRGGGDDGVGVAGGAHRVSGSGGDGDGDGGGVAQAAAAEGRLCSVAGGAPWRAVWSEAEGRIFYFNTETMIGHFDTPSVLVAAAEAADSGAAGLDDDDDYAIAVPRPLQGGSARTPAAAAAARSSASSSSSSSSSSAPHSVASAGGGRGGAGAVDSPMWRAMADAGEGKEGGARAEPETVASTPAPSEAPPAAAAEWTCAICTYINKSAARACEMCQTANPEPAPKRSSSRVGGALSSGKPKKRGRTR